MDTIGGILESLTIAADTGGHQQLLDWAGSFGQIIAFGIEGTGSYGVGLTSFIRRHGHRVIEINRPDRRMRRLVGKSDTLDAARAARAGFAGFAGFATAEPKTADGTVEMIRHLKVAHDTAAEILIVVGDNPHRIRSEAALWSNSPASARSPPRPE